MNNPRRSWLGRGAIAAAAERLSEAISERFDSAVYSAEAAVQRARTSGTPRRATVTAIVESDQDRLEASVEAAVAQIRQTLSMNVYSRSQRDAAGQSTWRFTRGVVGAVAFDAVITVSPVSDTSLRGASSKSQLSMTVTSRDVLPREHEREMLRGIWTARVGCAAEGIPFSAIYLEARGGLN